MSNKYLGNVISQNSSTAYTFENIGCSVDGLVWSSLSIFHHLGLGQPQSSEQPHQDGSEEGAEAEPRHQPEQQQRARQLLVLQGHLHTRAVNQGSHDQ